MSGPVNLNLVRRAPRSSEDLLTLLFEGLDWPKPANRDIDEIPLMAWSPEELHLDPSSVSKLTKIRQLPKLTDAQPFGVFILSFEGGRLPVGAVRRVVNKLVRKQRATRARAGSLWDLHDLIFFCQSDAGTSTLHIVAFKDTDKVPVMKVISWSTDATDNRIALIAKENLPDLVWPTEGAADVDSWREQWSGAFTASYREGVRSADALATRMADVAKVVRDEALALYEVETEQGPLRELFREIKVSLKSDLTPVEFADLYAQTMVYGLLTARITHPEEFHADAVSSVLMFENPFLDALYSSFRRKGDQAFDVDEFGLHDLAELLSRTDVNQLLADFGVDERKDDPVVFFYEKFLELYDPEKRRELGTYYTPIPVVRFMVRAVDHIIRDRFGLTGGVGDDTTWAEYSKRCGLTIPKGLSGNDPVIRMIDPATGTGTFLLEWYREAVAGMGRKATAEQKAGVVDRMDAFEINASSYAVAHLKTGLELPIDIRSSHRVNIRLTDTLAKRPQEGRFDLFADDPIAEEGLAAEDVKFKTHHSVVIGNPPYMRVAGEGEGGWIAHPADGTTSLFNDIHAPARKNTIFSHQASLFNLYVYFWRWAIWKAFEQIPTGPAVVGFITASSWLSGPGFLGLRQLAREVADEICVIDLGGDNLAAIAEENVFPIQTPVAIVVMVRSKSGDRSQPATTKYHRVRGSRGEKLKFLDDHGLDTVEWEEAPTDWHSPLIPPSGDQSWQEYPALTDLLPWQQPGCKFGRTWPIAPDPSLLKARWKRLMATEDLADRAACFVTSTSGRRIDTQVSGLPKLSSLPVGSRPQPIVRYSYRSFDRQWAFDDPRLAALERPSLWASMSDQQVFIVSKTTHALGPGPAAVASAAIPDLDTFRGSFGGKDVIPLYRDAIQTPNVSDLTLEAISSVHLLSDPDAPHVTHIELFNYCYGLLSGTDYTDRFSEELVTPGPRVPITAEPDLFRDMAAHGEHLIWLHTFGERFSTSSRSSLKIDRGIQWKREPSRIPEDSNDFKFLPKESQLLVADGVLGGVPAAVWDFEVSGMPIVKKWLGYRTRKGSGRSASSRSPLDQIRPKKWNAEWSQELREIVFVLNETIRLQEAGVSILERILDARLIGASDLPEVPPSLRMPPRVNASVASMI